MGAIAAVTTSEATVTSAYSPPLLQDGAFTSRGGQTLTAVTSKSPGLAGGISFSKPRFGVAMTVEWMRRAVAGTNGPYEFELTYTTREPPDGRPQTVDVRRSVRWPDTSGSVTEASIALDLTYRLGSGRRPNVTVFGGPAYVRVSGHLEPLGFTAFRLGGHSVLFEDTYRLALNVSPAGAFGAGLGGAVNLPVTRRTAVSFGVRYVAVRPVDAIAVPSRILNSGEITAAEPLDVIVSAMDPIHVQLNVSGVRAVAGIIVRR